MLDGYVTVILLRAIDKVRTWKTPDPELLTYSGSYWGPRAMDCVACWRDCFQQQIIWIVNRGHVQSRWWSQVIGFEGRLACLGVEDSPGVFPGDRIPGIVRQPWNVDGTNLIPASRCEEDAVMFWGKEQIIRHLAPFLASVFFLAGWEDGNEHVKYLCWATCCWDKEMGDFRR